MNIAIRHLGHAQHFIGSQDCQFRLATLVGSVVVSTVGEYFPRRDDGSEMVEIGCGRTYETMVFRAAGVPLPCGCPRITDYQEIDFAGYTSADEAQRGHAEMVEKHRAIQGRGAAKLSKGVSS